MTDDEAFIRAIVGAPGDEAPRLVYADWLDERADPRGAYLRAEVEWAKAPSDDGTDRLRKAGSRLEPVWVYRVSRTPVGVCCDHLRFRESGPRLTDDAGRRIIRDTGLPFLPEHLAFLLNHNGGIPDPKYFPRRGRHGTEVDDPERFFALVPDGDPFCPIDLRHYADPDFHGRSEFDARYAAYSFQYGTGQLHGDLTFLPLSKVQVLGMIALGTKGVRKGKVYQFNRYTVGQSQPPILVAKSLPEFLHSIRPLDTFASLFEMPE